MHSGRKLVERLASAEKIIRETPVIPLRDERIDLFAKLEYLNGIGSVKDRPAFWILKGAIQRGEVGPGTTVVESSSGNFACALAAFCKMLELDFIPVIDPNVSPYSESVLRSQCVRVVKVEDPDDSGGFLKTRLETVQELLKEIPDSYWPNQYGNPDGMAAHYYLTGEEIAAFAREHLAGYKVPRSVDFMDELPRTGSGKVLKHQLRAPYWAGRTAMPRALGRSGRAWGSEIRFGP